MFGRVNGKLCANFPTYPLIFMTNITLIGLAGLGVTCSPRDKRFAGSNPAEIDGFFSGRKNPEYKSPGRDFKLGSRVWDFRLVKEPQE